MNERELLILAQQASMFWDVVVFMWGLVLIIAAMMIASRLGTVVERLTVLYKAERMLVELMARGDAAAEQRIVKVLGRRLI